MLVGADDITAQARQHAWDWFSMHSNQRMQTFNYFLISTAFLIAAYGTLLKEYAPASIAVALAGAWLAYWFRRLDVRSRQLIDQGRKALIVVQERLARRVDIPELNIAQAVERCTPGGSTYSVVIDTVHWTVVALFLAAAAYSVKLCL
jgi:hypothetical protein